MRDGRLRLGQPPGDHLPHRAVRHQRVRRRDRRRRALPPVPRRAPRPGSSAAGAAPFCSAASISALTMRPFGPLPFSVARSMPACFAIRRASGDAKMRSPTGVVPVAALRRRPAAQRLAAGLLRRSAGRRLPAVRSPASAPRPSVQRAAFAPAPRPAPPRPAPPAPRSAHSPSRPRCRPATRILPSTPSSTASTSIVALSVSISAITSPAVIVLAFLLQPARQRALGHRRATAPASGCWSPCAAPPQTIFFTASTTQSGCGSASFSRLAA